MGRGGGYGALRFRRGALRKRKSGYGRKRDGKNDSAGQDNLLMLGMINAGVRMNAGLPANSIGHARYCSFVGLEQLPIRMLHIVCKGFSCA